MKKMADVSCKATPKVKLRKGGGRSGVGVKRKAMDVVENSALKKPRISTEEGNSQLIEASKEEARTTEVPLATADGGEEGGEMEPAEDKVEIVDFSCVRRQRRYVQRWEAMPSRKLVIALLYLALLYSGQTLLLIDLIR